MRLIFIRHGDPDYENDTLTSKGVDEAKALANIIHKYHIDEVYQSPLGRAKDTASYSLEKIGLESVTLDWLREFPAEIDPNTSAEAQEAYKTELFIDEETNKYKKRILWDILPSYFGSHPELFDAANWRDAKLVQESNMVPIYDKVIHNFDEFLKKNGYSRNGLVYDATESNEKTIAFFCHYGITSVLLSRLWNVSPFMPFQFIATVPTAVTEVVTEERQKGIAAFRTLRVGDISHLRMADQIPSFSARFCERYENMDERH